MLTRYHADTAETRPQFDVLAAVDIRAGRVVRLIEGDFDRETAYGADPAAAAAALAGEGARWLHVVDLDGARLGAPAQPATVAAIVARVGETAACEVAGGLRTEEAVEAALATGAARAVVGTAALRDPVFAHRLVRRHGTDRIAAAIDVRDGLALGEGWRRGAPGVPLEDAMRRLADAGVRTFEVTAVDRDGRLAGPDLDLLRAAVETGAGDVIASGGIARVEDLVAVRSAGCRGAIVGRALYEGRFTLREAYAVLAT